MTYRKLFFTLPIFILCPMLLGSSGQCGILNDYTEFFIITDPVDTVTLQTDQGSLKSTSYERTGLIVYRHVFAFEGSFDDANHMISSKELKIWGKCKSDGKCTIDHMFETPPELNFNITTQEGEIEIGYASGNLNLKTDKGNIQALYLESQSIIAKAPEGNIQINVLTSPLTINATTTEGEIHLEIPEEPTAANFKQGVQEPTIDPKITCDSNASSTLTVQTSGMLVVTTTP